MECLIPTFSFDIFVGNFFTSFRLFTRLRVNNIRATGVLDKNRLRKCILGTSSCKKRESGHFKQRTSSKKPATLTVVDQNNSRVVYIACSESCEHKRFAQCWNKVERKYIREQPNQFHCYNQGQVQDWYSNEKLLVIPVCFNGRCSSGCVGIASY